MRLKLYAVWLKIIAQLRERVDLMSGLLLVKFGEIALKGDNRPFFVD